ncbi:MAG: DUF6443 domain-containing protein, partial [Cyclobacteriaceae bacterium]
MKTISYIRSVSLLIALIVLSVSTISVAQNQPVAPTTEPLTQSNAPGETPYVTAPNLNRVRTYIPRYEYHDAGVVVNEPGENVMLNNVYADGLGRQNLTVNRKAGPGKQDIIQPVVYDEFGRPVRKLLPYADPSSALVPGAYRQQSVADQYAFYHKGDDYVADTDFPWAEAKPEQSPRGRITEQGAPGAAWQLDGGKTVQMAYFQHVDNTIKEYRCEDGASLPYTDGTYLPGTLQGVRTTDENGNEVIEYSGPRGVIYKAVEETEDQYGNPLTWAVTRYIYDRKGQLVLVFPPKLNKAVDEDSDPLTQTLLDQLAFRYRYDARGRMTAKRIPGKDDWDLILYNRRDLPVLTQDPVQRDNNQWSFTKYDHLNRPIMTGTVVLTDDEAYIRLRTGKVIGSETGYERVYMPNEYGYTRAGSWPPVYDDDIETVTWYDDYSYPCGEAVEEIGANGNEAYALFGPDEADKRPYHNYPTGQVTGTAIRHPFRPDSVLYSATYYDTKLRPVESVSMNALGGTDRSYMAYSWAGEVLAQVEQHTGNEAVLQKRQFTYDHTGRLLSTDHTVEKDGGYRPVRWTDAQNVSLYGTLIIKNISSTSFDAGARSVQRIPAGRDGSVRFIGDGASSMRRVIGLDDGGFTFTPLTARHALYLNHSDVTVLDNGTLYSNRETWAKGDKLEVVRENGQVVYKKNGVVFFTSASPAQGELRAVCSFKLNNYYLEHVTINVSKPDNQVQTVTLAKNEYNALGELINKKLHSTDEGQSWLQDTDYRYNIRGWLERINDPESVSLT